MTSFAQKKLILASQSKARGEVLKSTGLHFSQKPANIDESAIKDALLTNDEDLSPSDLAELLAQTKAINVSQANPSAYVIGADQTMSCDGLMFNKASNLEEARDNFLFLRGKTHILHAAICIARDGEVIWSMCDDAHLTMINFSHEFLGTYLAEMKDEVLTTVGGYQLENMGSLLFEKISGDYHTILGLPLMPLLEYLRSEKAILK